jgi:HK97 family phage major capsid protein
MKELLKKLHDRFSAVSDEMKQLVESTADAGMTEEQKAKFETLSKESDELIGKISRTEKAVKAEAEKERFVSAPIKVSPIVADQPTTESRKDAEFKIPASVRRGGQLKAFKNDERLAFSFGQWLRAANGVQSAKDWCNDNGVMLAVSNETTNTQGGYIVPQQFDNALVDLRLQYGVFRRNARVRQMTSDTLYVPRRTGGLTAYWTSESGSITESTKAWDQIQLVAKKLAAVTRMTTCLAEDAIINVADDLASEIAYAFAYAEDVAGFNGTGISTHGGITGVTTKIKSAAGTPTTTSAGGVIVATGNVMSEVTMGDLNQVVGKCPTYARMGAKWYCSPFFFDAVMARLAYAAGGNTVGNILGSAGLSYFGYPVELVEVLPSTDANSQILCLFGNLSMAASFGDRRQTTLAFSDSATVGGESVFEKDQIAVRGTERLDIVVHDVGNTSTAGPIVALQSLNA